MIRSIIGKRLSLHQNGGALFISGGRRAGIQRGGEEETSRSSEKGNAYFWKKETGRVKKINELGG